MNIDATKLSEILNGEWIVPPPAGWKFETVTMSKQQSELEKNKANLFIAIDEETWHKGSINREIYADWTNIHELVHEFVSDLSGIVVQRRLKNIDENIPQLLVDNTYEAIEKLAVAVRERFRGKVVAIIGSGGKSSAKSMLNHVLANTGKVIATKGDDNKKIDSPSTMSCSLTNPDYLLLEKVITELQIELDQVFKIIKPHISIITSLDEEQQRTSLEIAELKAKICEGISPDGFVLLNKEMLHFEKMKKRVLEYGATVITYGLTEDADIHLIDSIVEQDSIFVMVNIWEEEVAYDIPLLDEDVVLNSLAVLGAAWLLELNTKETCKLLKDFKTTEIVI